MSSIDPHEYFLEEFYLNDEIATQVLLFLYWSKIHLRFFWDSLDIIDMSMALYSVYVGYYGVWKRKGLSNSVKISVFLKQFVWIAYRI